LQQDGSEAGYAVVFPPELVAMLDRLEGELRAGAVSTESHQWLAGCGLTPERMAALLEALPVPARKIHLYHCDHRGLPLALVNEDGTLAWRGDYDEWGNLLYEDNPKNLIQSLRLPGQQYDEESGLHYNRYRYYDPRQGRYITQDPVGLKGGWNLYLYPLDPVTTIDPLGLNGWTILNGHFSQAGYQSALTTAQNNEPWYMNADAYSILSKTHNDMKRLNIIGGDQFFHCSAFCLTSKSRVASSGYATFLGNLKETRDFLLNGFGLYGKGKLSLYDMVLDNAEDLKVNAYGITCPAEETCSDRCKKFIDPEHKKTIKLLIEEGYLK
ncbi:RHS domain-containing protein, partial [Yokenella regensburgei]|uniref:RHS repeat-associated core domain-containing protein n=1 Tax=Yokenella regensburgei TaxID=158877 RepID=UPI003F13B6E8